MSIAAPTPRDPGSVDPHLVALARQTLHNLQYQHDWTALHIHHTSSSSSSSFPRPLISGLPPSRIYIHPDEQIAMLRAHIPESAIAIEREWVVPTHLREKWSLAKFAAVFDSIDLVPLPPGEEGPGGGGRSGGGDFGGGTIENRDEGGEEEEMRRKTIGVGTRRGGKRVLLGTIGDDSTIVYYLVHEGVVKPRQN